MANRCRLAALLVILIPGAVLAQEAIKLGDPVGKLAFTDIRSLTRTLADFGEKKAFVLVFTNTSCPLAQRYLPTIRAMFAQAYPWG